MPLLIVACAGRSTNFATVTELTEEPRRPPGVAVDPMFPLPAPSASASTRERLVVLRAPADARLPQQVVQSFFRAVLHEDEAELRTLLTEDAQIELGSQGSWQSARTLWQARFARLDYESLSGQAVLRPGALETYGADTAPRLATKRALPLSVQLDEILIRAPIAQTHAAKTRLFGDEIVFLLIPRAKTYKVSRMVEDFALP
jgi:hypothetical protein